MANINLRDLPATKDYMRNFVEQVFDPILSGQCNAIFAVPKFGCNSFIKYTLRFSEKIDPPLKDKISQNIWIRLELNGVVNKKDLWELILSRLKAKLNSKSHSTTSNPKTQSIEILQENVNKDKNIVFIINSAELLIENPDLAVPIFSISSLTGFVKFLVIIYKEVPEQQLNNFLVALRITNNTYLPMRGYEDMIVILEKEERWYSYRLDHKIKKRIAELSGGYAMLCRSLLSVANRTDKDFLNLPKNELYKDTSVSPWLLKIYQALSPDSQQRIKQLLVNRKMNLEDFSPYCIKTRIVQQKNGHLEFFSPLFRIFLQNITSDKTLFSIKKNKVYLHGTAIDSILSSQELVIFNMLWKSKNRTVSRERIAKEIWGKNWESKYSDWAIDRAIFKIRNKIGDTSKKIIQTQKGKGFKLAAKAQLKKNK